VEERHGRRKHVCGAALEEEDIIPSFCEAAVWCLAGKERRGEGELIGLMLISRGVCCKPTNEFLEEKRRGTTILVSSLE
jgi:hypothetical protein